MFDRNLLMWLHKCGRLNYNGIVGFKIKIREYLHISDLIVALSITAGVIGWAQRTWYERRATGKALLESQRAMVLCSYCPEVFPIFYPLPGKGDFC